MGVDAAEGGGQVAEAEDEPAKAEEPGDDKKGDQEIAFMFRHGLRPR